MIPKTLEKEKENLLEYFSDDKERTPTGLDIDFCGCETPKEIFISINPLPLFNRTIYQKALADLIEVGSIKAWQDNDGCWMYKITYQKGEHEGLPIVWK